MNTTMQTLKGFRDFLPDEAVARQWLKFRLIDIFEEWGFAPLETPTLEPLELFEGQIGEDEKLFFKFTDQGGRNVALRYDQTVPTCRVIAEYKNKLVFPFKRYQIQPAFRAEKPQKGRYREFIQCDADIIGSTSPLADAEVIALSLDIYKRLGFEEVVVRINSRELLKNIPYPALAAIDKLKKIGEEGVIADMQNKGIEFGKAKEYLTQIKNIQPDDTILMILSYLKDYGFAPDWYVFDPTIARSFSYSMGPIWEVEIPGFSGGSVLGGERYDGMVETITGEKLGATGFGLGFDRTLEAMNAFDLIPDLSPAPQVLLTVFNRDLLKNALTRAKKLREKNIDTEVYTDTSVRLDKQLKYADRLGIPYVVVEGPDEVKRQVVQIKNMKTRESFTVPQTTIIDLINKQINKSANPTNE